MTISSISKRLLREVDADAPTATWFEHLTVRELKDVVDAFGYALPAGLARADVLKEVVLLVDNVSAVSALIKAMIDDGYGSAIAALIQANGVLAWDLAQEKLGSAADDDSPLAALLEVGLAVSVNVGGQPVLAMPPAILAVSKTIIPIGALATNDDAGADESDKAVLAHANVAVASIHNGAAPAAVVSDGWQLVTRPLQQTTGTRSSLALVVDGKSGRVHAVAVANDGPWAAAVNAVAKAIDVTSTIPKRLRVETQAARRALSPPPPGSDIEVGACPAGKVAAKRVLAALAAKASSTTT